MVAGIRKMFKFLIKKTRIVFDNLSMTMKDMVQNARGFEIGKDGTNYPTRLKLSIDQAEGRLAECSSSFFLSRCSLRENRIDDSAVHLHRDHSS